MIYSLKYTDKMPEWKAGYSKAWFIRIRPAYKDDLGLLAHEEEHVRQWWVTLGISSILYLLSRRYRLWAEVKAYKEQLRWYPAADHQDEARRAFAIRLANHYGLDITIGEAFEVLGG